MSTAIPTFGAAALQKAIDRASAQFDHDDNAVLVAHVDDADGASLSLVVKVGDQWQVRGVVLKKFNEPFRYAADVIWHGKLW